MASKPTCSTSVNKQNKKRWLSVREKQMIKSVYEGLRRRYQDMLKEDVAALCGDLTKVSARTVFRIIKGNKPIQKPIHKGRAKIVLDDSTKSIIRRKVHGFYLRNELPTLKDIQREVNADADDTLNKISMRVLRRTLHEMDFRYVKRSRKSLLIERHELVIWRRKYLQKIRDFRRLNKKIYYTDETWLNEGHTKSKVWQDLNIKSARQAFIEGLSTGLKAPSGKGRRLIITHIGSDSGFLQGGLNVFTSIKTSDYHEDMNSDVFEKWFSSILTLVDPGSVIVMDNAPYHSRRVEKIPTSASRKADIIDWLRSKNIDFDESMLKVQLLDIVREHKSSYIRFAVDEMAREHDITVLRTPPYHCELNPIELIWAKIKNEVAQKNTTYKLKDVKLLLDQAIQNITASNWQSCITHTQKEEDKMWDVDTRVDVLIEPIIITPGEDSSDSELTIGSDSE
ncbi:uncharacterized protein LOC126880805 [Diabrotica virgifera virgifera]|uniref:Tc1-like transposase DDE domain-containing protein n=1 Tax=Diabrotica virgifera virgifera TaxID=50390 RepID=A0ABM5JSB0_DIAVI|nr:uncharacterized protein LOC126880805 [Diabrotica virgifera virgifera]